jgi:hypothetical protein
MACPKCGADKIEAGVCIGCGLIIAKFQALQVRRMSILEERGATELSNAYDDSEIDEAPDKNLAIYLLTLPICFVVACVVHSLPLVRLISFFMTAWIHEFGHTLASWCSSRFALPTVVVTFTFNAEKSTLMFLLDVGIGGYLSFLALRKRAYFFMMLGGLFLLSTMYLTLVVPLKVADEWRIYSGIGAQFWLSTVLIISFYYRQPKKEGWQGVRYVAPAYGMVCFVETLFLFYRIKKGFDDLPMGSATGGPDDSDGDLQRLMRLYGWTEKMITDSYFKVGVFCSMVILAHYFYFSYLLLEKRRALRDG